LGKELPLTINGKLKATTYEVRGDVSSQFITGLLYTLPLIDGDSKIVITTNLESKGYIDLTLDVLEKFGIKIKNNDYKEFIINGNQKYKARDYRVEGDYSQIAFWIVGALLGGEIECLGVTKDSLQGDREILDIVTKMGIDIESIENGFKFSKSEARGAIIDLSQCPDLGPAVTVLASLSKGRTEIINAGRLRIKESDRITSMVTELKKLGAKLEETENGIIIDGVEEFEGGVTLDSWNDHRVAMALAVASVKCKKPIIIEGADSVKKSYPHFWEDFRSLGGECHEFNLG